MSYKNEFLKVDTSLKKISMTPSDIAANNEVENINTITILKPQPIEAYDNLGHENEDLQSSNGSLNFVKARSSTASLRSQSLPLRKGRLSGVLTPFRFITSAMCTSSDQQTESQSLTEESQEIHIIDNHHKDKLEKEDLIQSNYQQIELKSSTPLNVPDINIEEAETDAETLTQEITEEPSTKTNELASEDEYMNSYDIEKDSLDFDTTIDTNKSIKKFTHGSEELNIKKKKCHEDMHENDYYILATPKSEQKLENSETTYSSMTIKSISLSEFKLSRSVSSVKVLPELPDPNIRFEKVARNTYKLENPANFKINQKDMKQQNYKFKCKLPAVLEVPCNVGSKVLLEHNIKGNIAEFKINMCTPKFKIL